MKNTEYIKALSVFMLLLVEPIEDEEEREKLFSYARLEIFPKALLNPDPDFKRNLKRDVKELREANGLKPHSLLEGFYKSFAAGFNAGLDIAEKLLESASEDNTVTDHDTLP